MIKGKIKNCHNVNSIFNTKDYIELNDVVELMGKAYKRAYKSCAENLTEQEYSEADKKTIESEANECWESFKSCEGIK